MALSARTSLTSSHVSTAMRLLALVALVFAALPLAAGDARAAKRFPVDSFSYYISEYESAVARIAKELEQISKHIAGTEARLSNEAFVSKAPPAVLEGARKQLADQQAKRAELERLLQALG